MCSPVWIAGRPPGRGTFTCCQRNHCMPDKDGNLRTIPCDKVALGPVMWAMLKARLEHESTGDSPDEFRKWCDPPATHPYHAEHSHPCHAHAMHTRVRAMPAHQVHAMHMHMPGAPWCLT